MLGNHGDLFQWFAGGDGKMIIVGIKSGVVEICVSITPDQRQTVAEMYPDHLLQEQTGDENIGWTFDGVNFTAPQG